MLSYVIDEKAYMTYEITYTRIFLSKSFCSQTVVWGGKRYHIFLFY